MIHQDKDDICANILGLVIPTAYTKAALYTIFAERALFQIKRNPYPEAHTCKNPKELSVIHAIKHI